MAESSPFADNIRQLGFVSEVFADFSIDFIGIKTY